MAAAVDGKDSNLKRLVVAFNSPSRTVEVAVPTLLVGFSLMLSYLYRRSRDLNLIFVDWPICRIVWMYSYYMLSMTCWRRCPACLALWISGPFSAKSNYVEVGLGEVLVVDVSNFLFIKRGKSFSFAFIVSLTRWSYSCEIQGTFMYYWGGG